MIPANLNLEAFALTPAELPGSGRFWLLWERLDTGPVSHFRYVGLLVQGESETPQQLTERARLRLEE